MNTQSDLFNENTPEIDFDIKAVVIGLAQENKLLQARQWVHEMLLTQTFLRFADATGQRNEFVELVLANMAADIKTTKANVAKDDISSKLIADEMVGVFAELSQRVRALAGSPATHLNESGSRQ